MKTINMVIGDPVSHSLSPLIHNAGYQAVGISSKFTYISCQVSTADIAHFLQGIRTMQNVRGISVTMPHKEAVIPHLDAVDPIAKTIGAVNTIVHENRILTGYNTDWIGTIIPLKKITSLKNKQVAVIGAGGAAKAIVYGLTHEGADVTIYNRTVGKAQDLARQFNCQAAPLDDLAALRAADIICNASSMSNNPPIDTSVISTSQIIFDATYSPLLTPLLASAKQKGAYIIYGTEMLLHQAFSQFQLYTSHKAPEDAMHQTLMQYIKGKSS